jgi:hypothetical protein
MSKDTIDTKIFDDRVDDARRAYMAAHDARRAAEVAEREAFAKWGEARIAKAEYIGVHVPGEPLKYVFAEGDRVVRGQVQFGQTGMGGFKRRSGNTRTIKQRGTIQLCREASGNKSYRNHNPIAGEWFVLNNVTAYKLDDSWTPEGDK